MAEIILQAKSSPDSASDLFFNLPDNWRRHQFFEPRIQIQFLDLTIDNFFNVEKETVVIKTHINGDPQNSFDTDTFSLESGNYNNSQLVEILADFLASKLEVTLNQRKLVIKNKTPETVSLFLSLRLIKKLGLGNPDVCDIYPWRHRKEFVIKGNQVLTGDEPVDSKRCMKKGFILADGGLCQPEFYICQNPEKSPTLQPVVSSFNIEYSSPDHSIKLNNKYPVFECIFNYSPLHVKIVDLAFQPFLMSNESCITLTLKLSARISSVQ